MSTNNSINAEGSSVGAYIPASAKTAFRVAIADATASADAAEVLLNPLTATGIASRVIPLGDRVTRIIVRARLTAATTAAATSPVVRLWAFAGDPNDLANCTPIGRIDADTNTASGITLTLAASPSGTTMATNESGGVTYRYSDNLPAISSKVGYDALGGRFVVALLQTSAAITEGACAIEIGVLN
jgi:hypothetical protein